MQQLRPVARPPAGLAVKPLTPIIVHAAKATVPNRASSHGLRPLLLPRISHSPAPLLPSVRGMGRGSCPAPRTKARDEVEREPQEQAPAKQEQGEEAAEVEREPAPAWQRSIAYQIIGGLYVCAYVFLWRTGELITVNAELALDRLRRYVRDNFFDKKR